MHKQITIRRSDYSEEELKKAVQEAMDQFSKNKEISVLLQGHER